MATVWMMSAKMVTLSLLKINVLWNKSYDVIICVYDVTSKVSSRDSNHIEEMIIRPKFGSLDFIRILPENPLFSGVALAQIR